MQVQAGEQMLQQALQRADLTDEQLPWDEIFAVLGNDQRPEDANVPRTGACPLNASCCVVLQIHEQRAAACGQPAAGCF
jgi:hypothetical protein